MGIPWGVVLTPFSSIARCDVYSSASNIRCEHCMAYLNSYCSVDVRT